MIIKKTQSQINKMREAGKILAEVMQELEEKAKTGFKTKDLDELAKKKIAHFKAEPGFLNYTENVKKVPPFPAALCVSVNSQLVHHTPSDYVLKDGDIVSLDLGIKFQGFFVDMAVTKPVGEIDPETNRLIKVTKKALKLGIKQSKEGSFFGDVSNTIQRYVESQGLSIITGLAGHGIGTSLHEEPQIPNFGKRKKGAKIEKGMVFCLEPMVAMGNPQLIFSEDGFGLETKDGSLTAHFEHTIAVANDGKPHILTKV